MNNQSILNNLVNENERNVFKAMYQDMETGKAILNPKQLGVFLREATLPNTILRDASFELMERPKMELNRTGINGRVLTNGYNASGVTDENIAAADVDFGANELDVKKLKALCEITDDEKDDNIEQAQFEQTLLSMMGERVGEDLEFWALFADTTIPRATNALLNTADGWLKKSGTKLNSTGNAAENTDGDFDLDNTVEAMFDKMIAEMPPRWRDRSKLAFYVPFEVEDAYRNLLKSRGTVLGDSVQTNFAPLSYKNIPVKTCTTLDAEDARSIDNTATSILCRPDQMKYGVFKQVSVEPERKPGLELTKYWFRIRTDVEYTFRNTAVTAKMTTAEVAAIQESHKL